MYGGLDISVSGMIAQRTRLNVIATNIANMDSVATPGGDAEPFRRKIALMTTGDPRKGEGSPWKAKPSVRQRPSCASGAPPNPSSPRSRHSASA